MNKIPNYQLTSHSIGSLGEIWTISWPLMIGLLSGSCMMFADRLLLARYATAALNACATAGMAAYVVMIIPMIIASISEVFVGRNHGAGQMQEIGKPVWQMLWLSALTLPIFLMSTEILPSFFFTGTGNEEFEMLYFKWIIYFAPAFCSTLALTGFFIGIGQVGIITISSVLGNLINIGLDILLIFGYGPFPEMGVKGAALATGLSQLAQTMFLGALFLRSSYRRCYGTTKWKFNLSSFKEGLQIGVPAGFGRFLEIIAHFIFFRIVLLAGNENFTIITIVQSFYLLMGFVVEGISKGVSTLAANLIGGKQYDLITKVIKAAISLQSLFFCVLALILLNFSQPLLTLFISDAEASTFQNPHMISTANWALFWMTIFFLLDGFGWIYMGLLTASGDTKFLLYASVILNWVFYIFPAYILLGLAKGDAAQGWMLIAFYALVTYLTYLWRYRSGKWLISSRSLSEIQDRALA